MTVRNIFDSMKTSSIHIVRRYGSVGGMENYVFELTHALSKQSQSITILCEENESKVTDPSIQIIVLGNRINKPRWLAQLNFSDKVLKYFKLNPPSTDTVIHSHERTQSHHITTFHGPPFLNRKRRLLDFVSLRIHTWTMLEKRELQGPQVRAIIPNSPLIAEHLVRLYPSISNKIQEPAYPGVSDSYRKTKRKSNGKTIGFIGKEWKRKGLDFACEIISNLRHEIPDIHFIVAGCETKKVRSLFNTIPDESYTLLDWSSPEIFFEKIDLLLHPARAEPFGMVIAEANAANIPVIISDKCGIASMITPNQGKVCRLSEDTFDTTIWVNSCADILNNPIGIVPLELSWNKLASQHIKLYSKISKAL